MSYKQNTRHYQPLWWTIKENKKVKIALKPSNLSEEQAAKQFRTIKKAIQKEKYKDRTFKNIYPNATLLATLDIEEKSATFLLDLKDYKSLFEA